MIMAFYISFGICLIMGAKNPLKTAVIIDFQKGNRSMRNALGRRGRVSRAFSEYIDTGRLRGYNLICICAEETVSATESGALCRVFRYQDNRS
jgi:hypothetical protein